ncbi:MAG: response regulator transcription factor [Gracilimonas sp.]
MIDKIRVLLIEDNDLLREGIVTLLKNQGSIKVKAATGRKDEVEQGINLFKPHVILLNFGLHSQNSLQVVKDVTVKYPDAKILVMDLAPTRQEIIQFIDAGATGFIQKEATSLEFIKTIRAVAKGEIVLPIHYADLLLSRIVNHAIGKGEIDHRESVQITEFELQLLKLLSEGLSVIDIGIKLQITPESVKTHIYNIKQNLYLFSILEPVNGN